MNIGLCTRRRTILLIDADPQRLSAEARERIKHKLQENK